ncbi:MAG: IS21 family transposase, partial [Gammaproteobacteria bacterium]|nr:IS21 family transposase [Gammaproteobacteria bacterium]
FSELPENFRQLQEILLHRPGGDHEMVDVLSLVLMHDERLIDQAVTAALEIERPSKQHVLNCLGRLSDAPRPQPLTPPLRLVIEPIADNQRYDRLRERNR